MNTIKIGDYNTLKMTRLAERPNPHAYGGKETFGIFLDGGAEGDILMPAKYVPQGVREGDDVTCFVYLDQDERLIATTEQPLAKVGDFAYLKCTWVNKYGAFLDWGLMKDVFCPFHEQKRHMEIGEYYIVHIHVDEESYRIVASAKVDKYLSQPKVEDFPTATQQGEGEHSKGVASAQPLTLLVWQKTDLGFKVIVDNQYGGLVYKDQIFQPIHTGDRLTGYLLSLRPDGKMDISLQLTGHRQTMDFSNTLLQWLKEHDGHCPLCDNSAPEDIKQMFQVSKKVFKRAVGDLYKKRLITLGDNGLTLVASEPSDPQRDPQRPTPYKHR